MTLDTTPLLWTDCGHGYVDEWRADVEGGNYAVWKSIGQIHLESTWTTGAQYPSVEHAQLVAQHHHDLRTIGIELAKEIRQLEFDADQLVEGPALDAARTMLRHSANRLRQLLEVMK